MTARYDVVLFGATGATGREAARYLGRRAPDLGITWAAAGRDPDEVAASVAAVGAEPAEILRADTGDPDSIDRLAAASGVLVNLVGPYARHGEVVYRACIDHGVVEVDLTGELDWLAAMLDRHQAAAAAAGARIVPVCGFEALPFDLAARYCAEAAFERFGQPVVEVDVALVTVSRPPIRRPSDAVSGGTWASAVGMLRRGPSPVGDDARALDPEGERDQPHPYELRVRRHRGTGRWLAPMVPSPVVIPPVVHRTAALMRADGDPTFSREFRYREGVAMGGPLGPLAAAGVATSQLGVAALSRTPHPVRQATARVLERVGPRPGEGPRPEDLDRWRYRLEVRATASGGGSVDAVVDAIGHPGYGSTPALVAEAALLLADPAAPEAGRCGFLTPATALGTAHLDRFALAGLTFRLR